MQLYIAGPMRGYPLENFPMFDECRDALIANGDTPLSPADNDREMGFDPTSDPPTRLENFPMLKVVAWDLLAILNEDTDGIVLLPGWEKSVGAKVERATCDWVGKKVFIYDPNTRSYAPETHVLAIGLCGYGGVGKDEVGNYLVQDHRFIRVAKGDLIKQAVIAINPLVERKGEAAARLLNLMNQEAPHWQDHPQGWLLAQDKVKVKYPDLRLFQQNIADGLVNQVMGGRDVWNERVWEIIKQQDIQRVVMTRLSLPQEAEELKSSGGYIWRVERPGYGPANSHPNEVALDDWDWDLVIKNDGGLEELRREVREAIWEMA